MTDEAHARRTDPGTSHQAAASLPGEQLRLSQWHVLETLRIFGPLTDERLAEIYASRDFPPQSPSGLRSRRSELADKSLVHDTGERQVLASGRKAIVWGHGPGEEEPVEQAEQDRLFA